MIKLSFKKNTACIVSVVSFVLPAVLPQLGLVEIFKMNTIHPGEMNIVLGMDSYSC